MTIMKSWGLAALAAVIIGVLTWLVVGSLIARDVAWWGLGLVLIVAVAAVLAQWLTLGDKSGARGWARFKTPSGLARLGVSVFFGLGAGLFVQQFISPTEFELTQKALQGLGADVRQVDAKVGDVSAKADVIIAQTAPRPWRAFDHVDGYWGEERRNCEAVYRFERRDHGLTVTLVKGAAILGDYRMTASIVPGGKDQDPLRATLRTSTEPDETHGQALVFTYHDDGGGYQRLDWLNESRSNAGVVKLEPCEAP